MIRRAVLLSLFAALLFGEVRAQTSAYSRYIIEFTDKFNSPYSISDPSQYLSQRAIDRRIRYGIGIDEFDLPINPDYIQAVTATGVTLLNRSKWLNSVSIQTDDSLALAAVRSLPFVKSASAVAARKAGKLTTKNKKWFENLPNEIALKPEPFNLGAYGTAAHQLEMLKGNVLHEAGSRGAGMIMAIFDGGWYNVPYLDVFDSMYFNNQLLGIWNFVRGNDSVYSYSTHGTEVLSLIAANKPGKMIGTAPDASFYLFVTEDAFSEFPIEEHNWAAAAEVADSLGVDVISSSLGYSQFDDPSFNHTYADMNGETTMSSRAASMASRKGMIVCNSAGNSGQKPWFYITAPADADGIITVGATDSTGTFTAFSSHGPTADGRIKPTVTAQGIRTWVIDPAVENNTTFPGNGTSFACPIIAGLSTCLWQAHPEKSNLEIIDAIKRSANRYYNPNDSFGYGIPNFQVADLILSGEAPENLQLTRPVLYPNPFRDEFGILYYLTLPEAMPVTIDIFDMIGRKIISLQSTLQSGYNYLPVSQLSNAANGAYFVKVNFADHSDVLRVLKN